jgi:lysyl-tRNA synthetase class 1
MPLSTDMLASNAWPFAEAEALLKRIGGKTPAKGYVLFETGYGPSGLPHIGTFGEVARTTMVQHAFRALTNDTIPTRLICFSDDKDGLRKVPDNLPNPEMIAAHLGQPLTSVPDPFGTHESFGHHMNARLRAFLDQFGFAYEFKSSTEVYASGAFDAALLKILANYDKVMKIMLPTLGEERQQSYSPFLPVSPVSGKVLLAKVVATHPDKGTITYLEEDGSEREIPVTGGHCKLQWKPDMGMRWAALDVDYEMYGKDHLVSAKLYDAICRVAGGTPPQQMMFELFLDEQGQKISKSKGNGITIDQWLRYAPTESLALYMFQSPRKAKKLYFDVIPKAVDEYLTFLEKYPAQDAKTQFANPVWHIHQGTPPQTEVPISFALLLNLASACNSEDASVLWGFISRYAPGATPEKCPLLDKLTGFAVNYYRDFVLPAKSYRAPTAQEAIAFALLADRLEAGSPTLSAEDAQQLLYDIGTEQGFTDMRAWFQGLYAVLLGEAQGPRMGSFIALYGVAETVALIRGALRR